MSSGGPIGSDGGLMDEGRQLLLKGGCVVSLDRAVGDHPRADVLIDAGKIAAVAPDLAVSDAEVLDASDMIVAPGFVDSHRHLWEGILRNIAPDATLADYFRDVTGVLGAVYRPEDVYAGTYLSALGALDAGVTTILDWAHIQNSPAHADAGIQALRDAGVRAVFAYGSPANRSAAWWQQDGLLYPEDIRRVRTQHFNSGDQLLTLALAAVGPGFAPDEVVLRLWRIAREVGAPITVHIGVGINGQQGHFERFGRVAELGPDTTYIHCSTLNRTEWQMIADSGGSVTISAPIEMQMGHGTPPIQTALELGIRPGLSVDVETSMPGDMFTQMRSALALQRGGIHERALRGETNLPALIGVRDVLEFATIDSARTCGLAGKVGTLTPGKDADIILLRTDRMNVMPVNDPVAAIVLGMDVSNVDTVFVSGRLRKRGGKLVGVDTDRVRALAYASRDHVLSASNFRARS